MINYSNIKEYKDLPFEEYINLKGFSHSYLKNEQNGVSPVFFVSDKMYRGTLVDGFLTQPDQVDFNSPLFLEARTIAMHIEKQLGHLIKFFVPQISYTADAEFNGFKLPVCGRLDWLLPKHAVIDLKVTEATDIHGLIRFMKYDNQLWNYARMAGVKKSYIIAYNAKLKKCLPIIEIDCSGRNEWWESKILKFGTI